MPHGWARLRFSGRHFMHLASRLIDEREQHAEGNTTFGKQACRQVIHVVREVACEDSSQMQITPVFLIKHPHAIANQFGHHHQALLVRTAFHKDGNLGEVHLTLPAECLHGIHHATSWCRQDVLRHTACRMHKECQPSRLSVPAFGSECFEYRIYLMCQ